MAAAQTGITSFLICSNDHYTKRDQVQIRAHPKFANGATVTFQDTDILQNYPYDAIYSIAERTKETVTELVFYYCSVNWQNLVAFHRTDSAPGAAPAQDQRVILTQEYMGNHSATLSFLGKESYLVFAAGGKLGWFDTADYLQVNEFQRPCASDFNLIETWNPNCCFILATKFRRVYLLQSKFDVTSGKYQNPEICAREWNLQLPKPFKSFQFFASKVTLLAGIISDERLELWAYRTNGQGIYNNRCVRRSPFARLLKFVASRLKIALILAQPKFNQWLLLRKYSLVTLLVPTGLKDDENRAEHNHIMVVLDNKLQVLDAKRFLSTDIQQMLVHVHLERTDFFINRLMYSNLAVFMVHKSRLCPVTVLGQTILIPTENSDGIMALQACTSSDDELIVAGVELAKRIKMRFQGV